LPLKSNIQAVKTYAAFFLLLHGMFRENMMSKHGDYPRVKNTICSSRAAGGSASRFAAPCCPPAAALPTLPDLGAEPGGSPRN